MAKDESACKLTVEGCPSKNFVPVRGWHDRIDWQQSIQTNDEHCISDDFATQNSAYSLTLILFLHQNQTAMKKTLFFIATFFATTLFICAQSQKDREIFDYVSKQLALSKEEKNRLRPVFYSYRKELRSAKNIYDNLKEKNLTAIRKDKLTSNQAIMLNNARWASDAKVLEVRKKYSQKFATVLSPQQVYYLFSYANDSKSKRASK